MELDDSFTPSPLSIAVHIASKLVLAGCVVWWCTVDVLECAMRRLLKWLRCTCGCWLIPISPWHLHWPTQKRNNLAALGLRECVEGMKIAIGVP